MAKRCNAEKNILPNPGDVFLMPLKDGLLGACRVIRKVGEERILVAATPWIGSNKPGLSEPVLKEVLMLNHHDWRNQPFVLWTSYPVPPEFTLIGSLKPRKNEEQIFCNSFGHWELFPIQVLAQWRWDNDRESVLKEDEEQQQEETRLLEIEAQRRREDLSNVTLEELHCKLRFQNWEEYVSDVVLEATRKVFLDTIDSIIGLGSEASEGSILEKLRWCIESLNKLDVQHDEFIGTMEREDICAEFEEIVHASGLGHYEDLVDEWREW